MYWTWFVNPMGISLLCACRRRPQNGLCFFRITVKLWTPEPVELQIVFFPLPCDCSSLEHARGQSVFHTHTHLNCYFRIIHPTQPFGLKPVCTVLLCIDDGDTWHQITQLMAHPPRTSTYQRCNLPGLTSQPGTDLHPGEIFFMFCLSNKMEKMDI